MQRFGRVRSKIIYDKIMYVADNFVIRAVNLYMYMLHLFKHYIIQILK